MATGLNNIDIIGSVKKVGVCLISVLLASCGVIQSKNIEEMSDNDRLGLLSWRALD